MHVTEELSWIAIDWQVQMCPHNQFPQIVKILWQLIYIYTCCWKVLVGSFLSWWFRQKPFWLQGHFIGTSKWFERETVVTDAARDRGSQTWNWKWKTISCFNWKVSTHHLALWNIVSGTNFSQPWIKVSLTSCLDNLIIKCQGFKFSWTIFTFQFEQTAFTQSINLTFTSLLIYTHSKSTFWF